MRHLKILAVATAFVVVFSILVIASAPGSASADGLALDGTAKSTGAYFLPEVDDEVVIAFEQGSVRHYYVLGSLWSDKEQPPESKSEESEKK